MCGGLCRACLHDISGMEGVSGREEEGVRGSFCGPKPDILMFAVDQYQRTGSLWCPHDRGRFRAARRVLPSTRNIERCDKKNMKTARIVMAVLVCCSDETAASKAHAQKSRHTIDMEAPTQAGGCRTRMPNLENPSMTREGVSSCVPPAERCSNNEAAKAPFAVRGNVKAPTEAPRLLRLCSFNQKVAQT